MPSLLQGIQGFAGASGVGVMCLTALFFGASVFATSLPALADFVAVSRTWSGIVTIPLLVVAYVAPGLLAPLNRLWLKFGLLLYKVMNPLILGLLFFVTIMPIGLIMRAFGKDFLRLRLDRQAASYWIDRRPPGPPPQSMKNQF